MLWTNSPDWTWNTQVCYSVGGCRPAIAGKYCRRSNWAAVMTSSDSQPVGDVTSLWLARVREYKAFFTHISLPVLSPSGDFSSIISGIVGKLQLQSSKHDGSVIRLRSDTMGAWRHVSSEIEQSFSGTSSTSEIGVDIMPNEQKSWYRAPKSLTIRQTTWCPPKTPKETHAIPNLQCGLYLCGRGCMGTNWNKRSLSAARGTHSAITWVQRAVPFVSSAVSSTITLRTTIYIWTCAVSDNYWQWRAITGKQADKFWTQDRPVYVRNIGDSAQNVIKNKHVHGAIQERIEVKVKVDGMTFHKVSSLYSVQFLSYVSWNGSNEEIKKCEAKLHGLWIP